MTENPNVTLPPNPIRWLPPIGSRIRVTRVLEGELVDADSDTFVVAVSDDELVAVREHLFRRDPHQMIEVLWEANPREGGRE